MISAFYTEEDFPWLKNIYYYYYYYYCYYYSATSDPRNAAVTETQLNDISEEVGNCWKDVGIKLGMSAARIKNIDEENRINREKALAILIGWKWKEGRNATVGKLADVLEKAERKDIAEKLLGELKNKLQLSWLGTE